VGLNCTQTRCPPIVVWQTHGIPFVVAAGQQSPPPVPAAAGQHVLLAGHVLTQVPLDGLQSWHGPHVDLQVPLPSQVMHAPHTVPAASGAQLPVVSQPWHGGQFGTQVRLPLFGSTRQVWQGRHFGVPTH
jgi:hypothetical protein